MKHSGLRMILWGGLLMVPFLGVIAYRWAMLGLSRLFPEQLPYGVDEYQILGLVLLTNLPALAGAIFFLAGLLLFLMSQHKER